MLSKKAGIALAGCVVLCFTVASLTFLYVTRVPNQRNPLIQNNKDVANVGQAGKHNAFSCDNSGAKAFAYDAVIDVLAENNGKRLYSSHLNFKLQLLNADNGQSWGVASQILINESGQEKKIDDVLFSGTYLITAPDAFITSAKANTAYLKNASTLPSPAKSLAGENEIPMASYFVYTDFNKLGLAAHHPLSVLSQVIKTLSVGKSHLAYHYAFDPMQRVYQYSHKGKFVERMYVEPVTQNKTPDFNGSVSKDLALQKNEMEDIEEKKHAWVVSLANDCLPQSAYASEQAEIQEQDFGLTYRYVISLKRIENFLTIDPAEFTLQANAANVWQGQQISQQKLAPAFTNREQMLQAMQQFTDDKNTGALAQAAAYMIDNVPVPELVDWLSGNSLRDTTKRDIIFGLGLADHPQAEKYMINTIKQIPAGENINEVQQVRLMVALAGHGRSGNDSFQFLNAVSQDQKQTNNVSANALINLGSLAANLHQRGGFDENMQRQLRSNIDQSLDAEQNASQQTAAIYALGNARLQGYDAQLLGKLESSNSRERYAAGTVVAQNPQLYTQLIDHIQSEPSNLVITAIVNGLQVHHLSSEQLAQLHTIASAVNGEKRAIIERLLYSGS